jgi:Ca2+-binding RTX toxin-like protein
MVAEQLENRVLLTVTFNGSPQWNPLGPAPTLNGQTQGLAGNPVDGAVNQVLPYPGQPNTYFVASPNGGVWRSTDVDKASPNWTPLTDTQVSLSTASLALDPNNANTLYAGIGHTSSGAKDGGPLTGLLKTTNALDATPTFVPLGASTLAGHDVDFLQVSRRTTADGAVILAGGPDGLFLSEDGGKTFKAASGSGNLPLGNINDLIVDRSGGQDTFYVGVSDLGIFSSHDGKTWTDESRGLTPAQLSTFDVIRLAIHTTDATHNVLYAAEVTGSALANVYSSVNGANFAVIGAAPPAVNPGNQGALGNLSIAADPNNDNLVYIGGDTQPTPGPFPGNLFVGDRNTGIWTSIVQASANGTAPHADSRNLVFDANGNLIDADDGGIYSLSDPSSSVLRVWRPLDGNLQITEFYSVAYDHVNNTLYGGAQDTGVPEQQLAGDPKFDESQTGQGDGTFVAVAYPDATHAIHYTATNQLGLTIRTLDDIGFVTSNVSPAKNVIGTGAGVPLDHLDPNGNPNFDTTLQLIQPFWVNAVDPNRIFVGTHFLYESTDMGQNFKSIGGVIDNTHDGVDNNNDTVVDDAAEFAPNGDIGGLVKSAAYGGKFGGANVPDIAYVGVDNGKILLRDHAGGAFNALANYHGAIANDIVLDPDNWKTVYVVDSKNKVWRSTNAGQDWQDITGNFGNLLTGFGNNALRTIEIFPGTAADGDESLLVGGQGGVYRLINSATADANAIWTSFGQGLPNVIVTDLHYDKTDDVLVAGTFGRGIWSVTGAGAQITTASVLDIEGTGSNDNITLIRDPNNPSLLNVTVNGVNAAPIKLSGISNIVINTGDGDDNVTVDEANGEIETNIDFNGGAGVNHLDKIHNPSFLTRVWRGIKRGVSRVGEWLGQLLHIGPQSQDIPLVNQSPGKTLNGTGKGPSVGSDPDKPATTLSLPPDLQGFGGAFQSVVLQHIADYLAADPTPTPEEFLQSLGSLDGEFAGVKFSIDPASATTTITASELQFNIDLHIESTEPGVLLDFADLGKSLGISFGANAKVDFAAALDFHVGLGVDLTSGLSDDESFYIAPQSMSITGKAHSDDFNASVAFGLLKAQVAHGTFDISAGLTASFADPNHNGRLTLSNLFGSDILSLVTVTPTITLAANLPASASVSGLSTSGTITLSDDNLLDSTPPVINATGFGDAFDLSNITPEGIINALNQLGTTLNSIVSKLNVPGGIPFVANGLEQLVNLVNTVNDFTSKFYDVQLDTAQSYTGQNDPASSFKLTSDAHFKVKISDDADTFDVTVHATETSTNTTLADLAQDVANAIKTALPSDLQGKITASVDGTKISIHLANPDPDQHLILRYAGDDDGMHQLGFEAVPGNAVFKFDDLDSLSALLAQLTGLSQNAVGLHFDTTLKQLVFHLELPASFDKDISLDFTKGLGPLTVVGDATLHFHAAVGISADLGIDLSSPLSGSLGDHLFIKEGSGLHGDFNFTASNLNLFAAVGLVGIGVHNGTASLGLSASFNIDNGNGTPNELIKFSDITSALPTTPTLSAFPSSNNPVIGSLSLPLTFPAGIPPATVTVQVLLDTSNASLPLSVKFDSGNVVQNVINSLGNLSLDNIIQLILDLANKELPKIDALNKKLPVIDQSVNDLLGFAKQLASAAGSITGGLKQAAIDTALTKISDFISSHSSLSSDLLTQITNVQTALTNAKTTLTNSTSTDPFSILGPIFDQLEAFRQAFVAGGGSATDVKAIFDAFSDSLMGIAVKNGLALFDEVLTKDFLSSLSDTDKNLILDFRHSMDGALSALTSSTGGFSQAASVLISIVSGFQDLLSQVSTAAQTALQPALDALTSKAPSLDHIANLISEALGLPDGSLTLTFANNKLTAQLHWAIADFDKTVAANIATPDLGIVKFSTAANFTIHLGATLDLGFGLDFTGGTPTPFLLDNSKIEADASINGSIDLAAQILGVDVHIGTSSPPDITLASTSDPSKPASLTFALTPNPDSSGFYTFDNLTGSSFTFTGDGTLSANLPITVGSTTITPTPAIKASVDLNNLSSFDISVDNLSGLLDAILGSLDFGTLIQGFEGFLDVLKKALESDILKKLPVIGDDVDGAAKFIDDLHNFADNLKTQLDAVKSVTTGKADVIKTFIFNALGSSADGATGLALGILKNNDSNPAITKDDITVNLPDDLSTATEVSVIFKIGGTQHANPHFDLGLSGFGLGVSTSGGIDLDVDYAMDIDIGISRSSGFFFGLNNNSDPEVSFGVHAKLDPGTQLGLNLFFLNLTATDHQENSTTGDTNGNGQLDGGTGFDATVNLDLSTSDPSNRLSLTNLQATVTPTFTTAVTVDLDLVADINHNKNLPTLSTNLLVNWAFSSDPLANQPLTAHLYNISLDFGQFFHNVLAPFFQKFNQFVDPIRPILDILNTDIPVISQLSQLVGGPEVTFASAIQALGNGFDTIATVENILNQLHDLANAFSSLSAGSISFGNFDLSGLGVSNLIGGAPPQTSISPTTLAAFFNQNPGFAVPGGSTFTNLTKPVTSGGLGIKFPLFSNPSQIVNLLFGKPVDLIQWDVPKLDASFQFDQLFGPILPPIPLFARIHGELDIVTKLFLGFDTRGFQTGDFLNGFYFGDFQNGTTGPDTPEISLTASFTAGAELNVVVASAGVEGGLAANVSADWNDPNHDGKFYLDEINTQLARGLQCVLEFTGGMTAFFDAYVKIGFDTPFGFVTLFSDKIDLGHFTIFNFDYTCPPVPPPILAHVDATGLLILHVGPNAGLRQPGLSTDVAETMTVKKLGPGKFQVSGFGETQEYDGVNAIFADGGNEDDVITLDPSVDVPATLKGGAGNDQLTGGSANDSIDGGDGDDQLIGGLGNDTITGDAGNDLIVGGAGADSLLGGDGDDIIYGADQTKTDGDLADFIDGGAGNDNIQAGPGDDTVHGGAGNDRIDGGDGNDHLFGEDDADLIEGGAGSDEIDGGSGDDILYGEGDKPTDVPLGKGGNDTIRGGDGNDTITDDEGNDSIDGGTGDDFISSGAGNDIITGGDGNDSIVAADGNDSVHGNGGNDIILGDNGSISGSSVSQTSGTGNDSLFGDDGDDQMYGQGGNDSMEGGTGADSMSGGDGNDTMRGGDGNDTMSGDAGADLMFGEANNDSITGGTGADSIFGGLDNDTIYGQEDNDYIEGGAGNDSIFGGSGDDRIIGGASSISGDATGPGLQGGLDGADSIIGDTGDDIILADNGTISPTTREAATNDAGGAGNDTVFGGDGNDIIFGEGGDDTLIGDSATGTGNDVIIGDQGSITLTSIEAHHSTVTGAFGNDTITGSGGDDIAFGGDGNDSIAGDAGADVLFGDNGIVTLSGGVVVRMASQNPESGGNDTITGSAGPDVLIGGQGNDNLSGGTEDNSPDIILGDNGTVVRDGTSNDVFTTDPTFGGSDTASGGGGNDIIIGGSGGGDLTGPNCVPLGLGDILSGDDGDDIIIGDNAHVFRNASNLVTMITTTDPSFGGADTMDGGTGNDTMLGGQGPDSMVGGVGNDVMLGDNGFLTFDIVGTSSVIHLVSTSDPTFGCSDNIQAGDGDDIVMGGTDAEFIDAGTGNDLVFGDHGMVDFTKPPASDFTSIDTQNSDDGGNDTILGNTGNDILIGGQGADQIFGGAGDDDLIGGHNVAGGDDAGDALDGGAGNDVIAGDNASIIRRNDAISPLYRTLTGAAIYDLTTGLPLVNGTPQVNPSGALGRDVVLFDHSTTTPSSRYGNDVIAGGANNDVIFGELGNDVIMGDGSVVTSPTFSVIPSADTTDGDDYVEGNGGNDVIYGGLGQDDLIGGSSDLFGLTTPAMRPDGSDSIYGGNGTDLARNTPGDTSGTGHARDSDVIVGDNGDVYRLVNGAGSYLTFNYDNYGALKIIPRAVKLLDYTLGGAGSDIGAADLLHGEAGDDFMYGGPGNDVMFGEGQDDNMFGGAGSDRIYGGTGEDGILGDDGIILTSRNGLTEPLDNLTTPNAQFDSTTPGPFTGAWLFITGRLNKSASLLAWSQGGNDVIYGGLGDDFLHGGAGDDAISGAEAQALFYNELPVTNTNPLGYDPVTRKLAAYDANNPLARIPNFLLNFDAVDSSGNKIEDGKDHIFGDDGNDWLVGGTGDDRLFGGVGDDLMNLDDNLDTNGGLNNQPDSPLFADRDFAYGGDGLDVLIANTGGDRMFDWVGEFNSFIVPFSPFGEPTVNRTHNIHTDQFIRDLGREAGADPSRPGPNGELGLFLPSDPQWQANTGSPRDPQAGNTQFKRDTQGAPEDDRGTALPLAATLTAFAAPTPTAAIDVTVNSTDVTVNQIWLTTDPDDDAHTALFVGGSNGDDVIQIQRGSTATKVRVVINGVIKGEYDATNLGRIIVYGNSGNDNISVNANVGPITALLYGGDGNDTLTGGAGFNLLDGGAGNDSLTGGESNDMLFGGGGSDLVNGGNGDDALVAGTFVNSGDLTTAAAIMAAWCKSSLNYAARISALNSGVNLGGIAGMSDSYYRLNASVILDDGVKDTLNGQAGQDWFLASTLDLTDQKGNETTTQACPTNRL